MNPRRRRKWRIASWDDEGCIGTIEYGDGVVVVCDSPVTDEAHQWCSDMWIDSSDDCHDAKLEIDGDGCFALPASGEWPTRWRPARELPRWLRVTPGEIRSPMSKRKRPYKLAAFNLNGRWVSELVIGDQRFYVQSDYPQNRVAARWNVSRLRDALDRMLEAGT